MTHKMNCAYCKNKIEGKYYSAVLLGCDLMNFCNEVCCNKLRDVKQRKAWSGKEKLLSRRDPVLYQRLYGSIPPSQANKLNSDSITSLNNEFQENDIYHDESFVDN